ncbi:MAG: cytochrome c oxidase subunit II [Cyclobacteriaceae bacterium]
MLNLIIVVAVILVVAVLITVFRVTNLVDVVKPKEKDAETNVPSGNSAQGVLMLVFLVVGVVGFFYYSKTEYDSYNLPITSEHGVVTERLFWITMAITVFVFVVTQIFLFGFSWKYRYKKTNTAHYYPHNNKLEMIWTFVPAVVLAWLIISGLKEWSKITGPAPEGSEVIEVMGYQFAWAFRYPGKDGDLGKVDFRKIDAVNQMGLDLSDRKGHDDFMPTQLVIPKNKPVHLKIRGRDVIHSVYNPHFRLQMNAVPGMPTRFWFVPTVSTAEMRDKTGNPDFNYELVCNKICGKSHFGMKGIITVLEQDEYDSWYMEQQENSWLKQNPDYLSQVPNELKEAAIIASGLEINVEEIESSAQGSSK